jgi:hypothetical protein
MPMKEAIQIAAMSCNVLRLRKLVLVGLMSRKSLRTYTTDRHKTYSIRQYSINKHAFTSHVLTICVSSST